MNKKLLYLFLALVLCLPLVLVSCGDELTDKEIAEQVFREGDTALTLSFWLPVPDENMVDTNGDGKLDGFNESFKTRLEAVENAINVYLRKEIPNTKLDIVAVAESSYYNSLENKFEDIKEAEKKGGTASSVAGKFVNEAIKYPGSEIYEILFRDVMEQQLDIFFVGGYDKYTKYINEKHIYALNNFFTVGQSYNGLFKMIRASFFEATKINGNYYGIPNNHVYSEQGQYVLVDKALYDEYSGASWDVTNSLYDLEGYIEIIGGLGLKGVLPFYGRAEDVPGVVYIDRENYVAVSTSDSSYTPSSLLEMKEFVDYSKFYKKLNDMSYVSDDANGMRPAVQLYNGNLSDIADKENYYIIETTPPFASGETIFSSMFAISTHSANYERAMKVLYLLQDKEEFMTLLQYGVEEVDYNISYVNGEKVIVSTNSGYNMDLLYTGNCYRTYPDYGVPMSYWKDVQSLNLKTECHPYMNLNIYLSSEKLLREKLIKAEPDKWEELLLAWEEFRLALNGANATYWNEYLALSLSGFETSMNYDSVEKIDSDIKNASSRIRLTQNKYNRAQTNYENAVTEEDKQKYLEEMNTLQAEIDGYNETISTLESVKPLLGSFLNAKSAISDTVDQLASLYAKFPN